MNNADAVREAILAGVDVCGENRVQELTAKQAQHAYDGAPVHFIGLLQTNKVKSVVGKVALIQSVDSLRLLQAIQNEAVRQGIRQEILLEVNIGGEESKSGFSPREILPLVEQMPTLPNLILRGLMAIPPIRQNTRDNCKFYQEMYNLSVDIKAKKEDNVCVDILSMGMSDDFADAIRCGSTMIRVGTAIFGQRQYK
jgi:pyridoxal phosphate enzyme (YggS family)